MPDSQRLESFLVADIGSSTTKVGLVDRVGGDFRFVSSGLSASTAEPPASDVLVGLRQAIEFVQARTGRRFLADDGQLITPERSAGQGVDAFVVTTSAPSPLRVAIVGVSREVSLATAVRAIHGTYATLEATLALDQTGGRWLPAPPRANDNGADDPKKLSAVSLDPAVIAAQALARANPDVIVIVGGIDGGATTPVYEIANLVAAIVASGEENTRPTILFAGNRDARSQVAARVGNVAPFRAVDNVRPTLDDENLSPLQHELEALYIDRKITWLPGLNALSGWTPAAILPTARAFENVVRFVARRYNLNVLGADLGAAATTVITCRSSGYSRIVRADLGLGQNLENVIAPAGADGLMRWLPMEMDHAAAELRWLNHTLHPGELPVTREQARLMDAAGRAALATTVADGGVDVRGIDLILLTGRTFAHNSNPGALALLALDALQPSGVFTLAVDALGLAPAFGALASLHATAAAST
ncbi:MAG TPA: glutamate mutase L, partial [Anaerolineae bacterium]